MTNKAENQQADDEIIDISELIKAVLTRLPLCGAIVGSVTALAVAYSLMATPVYQADTRILVESTGLKVTTIQEVYEGDAADKKTFIQTQQKMLTSDRLLQNVFDHFELAKDPDFAEAKDPLDTLGRKVVIKSVPNTNLIDVGVKDENPQLAADMANYLVRAYMEDTLHRTSGFTQIALEKMQEELHTTEVAREKAVEKLTTFQKESGVISIETDRKALLSSLEGLEDAKFANRKAIAILENQIEEVRRWKQAGADLDVISETLVNATPEMKQLMKSRLDVKLALVEQRQNYGDNHRIVIDARKKIAHLNKSILDEMDLVVRVGQNRLEELARNAELLQNERDHLAKDLQALYVTEAQYRIFKEDLTAIESSYKLLLNRVNELKIAVGTAGNASGTIQIIDEAVAPRKAQFPQKTKIVAVAFLGSAVLAVLLAILLELMDKTVKRREEVENMTRLPVYGMITDDKGKCSEFTAYDNPKGMQSEAFRDLCTTLALSEKGNQHQLIAVTSPVKNDGKTFVSLNMAVTYARAGKKVLLIDTDMRSHALKQLWNNGQKPNKGLSDLLQGSVAVGDVAEHVMQPFKDLSMDVLFSGAEIDIPANLLNGEKFSNLLFELKERYDIIILDVPSVLSATDTRAMAAIEGLGFLLVVRVKSTEKKKLQMAVGLMKQVNANLLGTVLNSIENARDESTVACYGNDDEASKGVMKKIRKVIK